MSSSKTSLQQILQIPGLQAVQYNSTVHLPLIGLSVYSDCHNGSGQHQICRNSWEHLGGWPGWPGGRWSPDVEGSLLAIASSPRLGHRCVPCATTWLGHQQTSPSLNFVNSNFILYKEEAQLCVCNHIKENMQKVYRVTILVVPYVLSSLALLLLLLLFSLFWSVSR